LQDTQVSLAQVSAALGYSEASAFTRAFRRWSGQTPTAQREKVGQDASPVGEGSG
jgi:AraC-like DNA-binding protein